MAVDLSWVYTSSFYRKVTDIQTYRLDTDIRKAYSAQSTLAIFRNRMSVSVCMSVRKKVWNDSNFFCKKVCKIASVRRKIRFNQWESSIYFQILFISTTTHCLLMFVSRFINFINIKLLILFIIIIIYIFHTSRFYFIKDLFQSVTQK